MWLTTSEEATRLPSLVLTHTFSKTQLAIEVPFCGMLSPRVLRVPNLRAFYRNVKKDK